MSRIILPLPGSPDGDGVSVQSFEVMRVDYAAPEASGRMGGVQAGWPLWMAVYQIGPLADDLARLWRTTIRRLRGQQGLLLVRDFTRSFPKLYPSGFGGLNRAGGGAFPADGAATSWSVNTTRDQLTLNGLPASMQFRQDDQVGFRWTTGGEARRALVSCVEDVTGNGSGVATFKIEPPLPLVADGVSAVAYLASPTILGRRLVQPGEAALGQQDPVGMASFTLTLLQELLP